jgi:[ribosomal protein S5]-alanine N-acetyltransferase
MAAAPERIETERLLLRRPTPADAAAIFARYASDPEVTRYVGWPTHTAVAETEAFLAFSEDQWRRWPAGPYVICSGSDHRLLGGTGLGFDEWGVASTGYVLAKDAWGHGYATEALAAMLALAAQTEVRRLYALCHPDHRASHHVLEKCGFTRDDTYQRRHEFPNLEAGVLLQVCCYSRQP